MTTATPMLSAEALWEKLETFVDLSAVRVSWAEVLGPDYLNVVRLFLQPERELATSYPCPTSSSTGCPRAVCVDSGGIVARCQADPRDCDDVRLARADVVLHRFDLLKLGRQAREVLGLKGASGPTLESGLFRTLRLGDDSPEAERGLPVFFTIQFNSEKLRGVVDALLLKRDAPFVLVLPTTKLLAADLADVARRRRVLVLDLAAFTTIDASQGLVFDGRGRERLDRFRSSLEPASVIESKSLGSVARAASPAPSPKTIDRERLATLRQWRAEIDKQGLLVGGSPALYGIVEQIKRANAGARSPAVLILGETGVGKTHIAQLVHDSSERAGKPFKARNASGTGGDVNLQRGEWLGYAKNHGIAGIDPQGKGGHLDLADGGTLFVDEFVEFSRELQGVFLYVLEGQAVERVGGRSFKPDVRCVFATNVDTDTAVREGRLRHDLLARIGARITVPPLRERTGDVLMLARHFVGGAQAFSPRAELALLRHGWPENVRELRARLDAAVGAKALDEVKVIDVRHLALPHDITAECARLTEDEGRRALWRFADEIARGEGWEAGAGLQSRVAEILGVHRGQASRAYKELEFDQAR